MTPDARRRAEEERIETFIARQWGKTWWWSIKERRGKDIVSLVADAVAQAVKERDEHWRKERIKLVADAQLDLNDKAEEIARLRAAISHALAAPYDSKAVKVLSDALRARPAEPTGEKEK